MGRIGIYYLHIVSHSKLNYSKKLQRRYVINSFYNKVELLWKENLSGRTKKDGNVYQACLIFKAHIF